MNGIGMSGMDDASLEAKVQRILGKDKPELGQKLGKLGDREQRVALQDELMEAKKMARVSPAGALGLTPLLDARRIEYSIIDAMFDARCCYDRVYVYQIPPKAVVRRQAESRSKGSVIALSVGMRENETDKAHRGIIVSAGLSAMDHLTAHGMGLGHIVNFALFSPLRHFPDDELPDESLVVLHAGQCVSSEDTEELVRAGKVKLARVVIDGNVRHRYVLEDGESYLPETPFMPAEY
jgi:hypothetical protein